ILAARVLDGSDRPAGRLRSGEKASLEMDVRASDPLEDFVFGFAISTVAGSVVFGSNTELEGRRPLDFSGEGSVRLEIPALALAPGIYSVDAAVHARDGAPYDYRRDVLRFEVTAAVPTAGVWSPERRWIFGGGIRWRP
ncbi:MAG TPA: Wzt carbohydrate-binding domain-containing protein, partial [Thermoanaerobaculia bacterium]